MTITQKIQDALGLKKDDWLGVATMAAILAEQRASQQRVRDRIAVGQPGGLADPDFPAPPITPSVPCGGGTGAVPPEILATLQRNHWPSDSEAWEFYGRSDGSEAWQAANLVSVDALWAMHMDGTPITHFRVHRLVADSLRRILAAIWGYYGCSQAAIHATGLDKFDGSFNFRLIRGAANLSLHGSGAAVDFDAEDNPLGANTGRMPAAVVQIFHAEGWRWGGDYTGRKDWMHFEAVRCV